ncbi:MAG: alpha/beta fold hydrolase [Acidobacteria bacterium]|nr:alpha/beta fold hydrolase [Acidobacteriota bacterium]
MASRPFLPRTQFRPRRFLSGGHIQTIASFLLPRTFSLTKPEARLIEVEPGIRVLCHCYWQADRRSPLTVLVVHGLEGSAESKYMLGLAEKGGARGMNVVLMNQRTCGGTNQLGPTLYHSGRSGDVMAVAQDLIGRDRISRLALCGYSMGGNLVLKAAGEWGRSGPREFSAVAAVSPPLDLEASAEALHLAGNRLYEKYFLAKLRARMRAKARAFPGRYDLRRLERVKSLRDFDDRVTAFYCGFAGAGDYYARSSAANVVGRIAVPALVLYAANDPFIRILPETRRKIRLNSNISFVETADGGHCSFLGEGDGDDGHFAEKTVMDFFEDKTPAGRQAIARGISESEPEMTM